MSQHTVGAFRPIFSAMITVLSVLMVMTVALPVQAQTPTEWDAAREEMSRQELETLLERLETEAQSSAYSQQLREQASRSAELVRTRLREGDFQVGDRIVFIVEQEPEMSDTLTVRSGRRVTVPVIGDVPLDGVLRAELNDYMTEEIGTYIRDPVVRTETLIRILVQGEVGSPNFYLIPADRLITDVFMMAGGPTGVADLTDVRIERGNVRIWDGEPLQTAILQGRTLDHLNIQSGDRIMVPAEDQRSTWEIVRNVAGVVGTIATLTYALSRVF